MNNIKQFEENIDLEKWNTKLSSTIRNVLPINTVSIEVNADYYLFYDCTLNAFNFVEQQEHGNECVFLTYQKENQKLTILANYKYVA